MSVLFYPESIRILGSDANGKNVMLCKMAVDNIANLPAANAFISDGYVLSMGCKAIVINDNSKHRLNSQGQWVQIAAGTSTYTRAEIDSIISVIDAENANQQTEINYSINTGAKNICNWSASTSTISGVTFTVNADKTVSTNGTATTRSQKALVFNVPSTLKAGRYVLSGCPNGGEQSGKILYCLYIWDYKTNARVCPDETGNGIEFDWSPDASHTYTITVDVRNGTDASGLIFKPMIRQSLITDSTFEPYAPTNRQLYEMILQLQGG